MFAAVTKPSQEFPLISEAQRGTQERIEVVGMICYAAQNDSLESAMINVANGPEITME